MRRNRHHLVPRSRQGTNNVWNLLLIDCERHTWWHKVFGNRTLDEVISLLIRVRRAKQCQRQGTASRTKSPSAANPAEARSF